MDGRDRTWMARVDVAQIKEGRAVPQLLQKDAIGPHAQRTLEQLLGADLREPLSLARIDHVHDIAMFDDELARILDREQPLVRRDQLDQRSEEHTSELQSLMRISYAVFCLQKKTTVTTPP